MPIAPTASAARQRRPTAHSRSPPEGRPGAHGGAGSPRLGGGVRAASMTPGAKPSVCEIGYQAFHQVGGGEGSRTSSVALRRRPRSSRRRRTPCRLARGRGARSGCARPPPAPRWPPHGTLRRVCTTSSGPRGSTIWRAGVLLSDEAAQQARERRVAFRWRRSDQLDPVSGCAGKRRIPARSAGASGASRARLMPWPRPGGQAQPLHHERKRRSLSPGTGAIGVIAGESDVAIISGPAPGSPGPALGHGRPQHAKTAPPHPCRSGWSRLRPADGSHRLAAHGNLDAIGGFRSLRQPFIHRPEQARNIRRCGFATLPQRKRALEPPAVRYRAREQGLA